MTLSFCCALLISTLQGASDSDPVERSLEKGWTPIEEQKPSHSTRDIMAFALEATARHWHPERVAQALEFLEKKQDLDPTSKTYGNFCWYFWQPKPVDPNAVEFIMQRGILLWNLYGSQLDPATRETLQNLINFSLLGIRNHPVLVSYTNIYLMKAWNLLAIGESFHNDGAAQDGRAMLQNWMQYTSQNGLHEYLSPTYSAVDLESLTLIRTFAHRPEDRALAEKGLQLLYWQSRANWFAPDQRLGGPHSRDYDYLTGHGTFDRICSDWGWMREEPRPFKEKYQELTTWSPANPSAFLETSVVPRSVWQRWGDLPDQYATDYIGTTASIGASGAAYGPEDKTFTINFGGGPKMVMANFFMDGRGDPYGQNKLQDKFGHNKAHHLIPFVASTQVGSTVLFLSAYGGTIKTPSRPEHNLACLSSHLDLPAEVVLWQGDRVLSVTSGRNITLDPSQPIFLRYQNTVVGCNFQQATNDQGEPIPPVFYRDGDQYHACRISWTHSSGAPKGEAHLLFLAQLVENLDDRAFAQFRNQFARTILQYSFDKGDLQASVKSGPTTTLSLDANLITGTKKTAVMTNPGILQINGHEIGQAILSIPPPPP